MLSGVRMRNVGSDVTENCCEIFEPSPPSSVLRRRRTILSVAVWKACDGKTSASIRLHQPHQSAKRSTKISCFVSLDFFCAVASEVIHGDAKAPGASNRTAVNAMAKRFKKFLR